MKNKHWQVLIQDEFDNLYHIGFYRTPQESIHDVNEFLNTRGLHIDEINNTTEVMRVELNEVEDIRIRFIEHLPLMVITAKEYMRLIDIPEYGDVSNAEELLAYMESYNDEMCLWDYPLEELDYCMEVGVPVVKVIFDKGPSRLFEIPSMEE